MTEEIKEICFPQDTTERKKWFKAASFSHPAKMHLSLQLYLIEHYTQPGDTILDPMFGSGSLLVACALGRNVIGIELEQKFVDMAKANWEKIKSQGSMLGYTMGEATILQGDARQLPEVLADSCIFSPPFAEAENRDERKVQSGQVSYMMDYSYTNKKQGKTEGQISNLPYGSIDSIVSSPPYAGSLQTGKDGIDDTKWSNKSIKSRNQARSIAQGYTDKADVVISSPPYENQDVAQDKKWLKEKARFAVGSAKSAEYAPSNTNIGNLKSSNYLEAMKLVYENCFKILKEKGLMVLVVKNFVRKGQVIRLDSDTIRLCENAGFSLQERLKRRLTQLSFWRVLEKKRWEKEGREYPADMMFEHILVFKKDDVLIFEKKP